MDKSQNRKKKRIVWKTVCYRQVCAQSDNREILSAGHCGKREFVPHDQVFSLLVFNCSLLLQKISSFLSFSSIRIVLDCFYLPIFHFEIFLT